MLNIYNKDYFDKYVGLGKTDLASRIHKNRWEIVERHMPHGSVLDYGCGPGTFASHAPSEYEVTGYDVNPEAGCTNIPFHQFDAVTFWDSLEHIPDFYGEIVRLRPKYLFITTPNLASVKCRIMAWRHYRPDEHLYYFDQFSLKVILNSLGYKIEEVNFDEGSLRNSSLRYPPKSPIDRRPSLS